MYTSASVITRANNRKKVARFGCLLRKFSSPITTTLVLITSLNEIQLTTNLRAVPNRYYGENNIYLPTRRYALDNYNNTPPIPTSFVTSSRLSARWLISRRERRPASRRIEHVSISTVRMNSKLNHRGDCGNAA